MATPKRITPTKDRPAAGRCRHRNVEKLYDCGRPIDREGWSWCTACVKEDRAARKAARSDTKAAKPKAAKLTVSE